MCLLLTLADDEGRPQQKGRGGDRENKLSKVKNVEFKDGERCVV